MQKYVAGLLAGMLFSSVLLAELSAQRFTRFRPGEPDIISAVAFSAEPFGVGKIVFKAGADPLVLQSGAVRISEVGSRIHYPAFSEGLTRIFANSGIAEGGIQTVWFLFRGEQPLSVTIDATSKIQTRIEVVPNRPFVARATLDVWWTQFNLQMQRQIKAGDYPEMAETYLTSMLSNRLGLRRPLLLAETSQQRNQLQHTTDLIFDVESVRVRAIRELMANDRRSQVGDLPTIPIQKETRWKHHADLKLDAEIEIEPLAHAVPQECFYVRFGNWDNQVWLKRLLDEYGSDLGRMVSLRGHKSHSETKMLDQLVLESSQIDEMFGGHLVADIAFIGRDFYIDDGPSIGIMLESKNGLFETNMRSRRKKFARSKSDRGVTLETIEVDGNKVTILATADNRIRSFYAVAGNIHLVTTSRSIVERFFQASNGRGSLANNAQFRYARAEMPVQRDDTIFLYLSAAFFESVLSPQYQIELARRNRALASIQVLQMAGWAASNEGFKASSIESMQANGFLPDRFSRQPDGSTVSFEGDVWVDSRRGRRGYFIPISDVKTASITQHEAEWLRERTDFYQNELGSMNPIFAGIKRYKDESDRKSKIERVVFDARIAPFGGKQWELMSKFLGPPMQSKITTDPADLIWIQLSLNKFSLFGEAQSQPHQVFAAIQADVSPVPPPVKSSGFFQDLQVIKSIPGYIGAWPSPGYLDMLPALGGRPDERGFTYSRLLGLWRMQHDEFSVIAFDRDRLEHLRTNLAVVSAERPAQFRLRIGDIAYSNLRGWVNALYYQRGWETSVANVRFINMISQQFGVPQEASLEAAQDFLGVELICPLSGDYGLTKTASGRTVWSSTSWPSFRDPQLPHDYQAPPMSWFRGMSADVYQQNSQFVIHGYIDIERKTNGKSILPSFNLFKGFDKVEQLPPALPGDGNLDLPPKHKPGTDIELEGNTLKPPKQDKGK